MREADLRASLQRIGVQVCGLSHGGELLDGRKKALMCVEIGIPFQIQDAKTLAEACSILWTRHPERALQLANTTSVLELAKLCGTTPTSVAKQLAQRPKAPTVKKRIIENQPYRELKSRTRMVRRLLVLEPELNAYAEEAAAQLGHRNVSKLMRDALWEKIALLVPMAPQFQPRRVQAPNGARVSSRRRTG